MNEPVVYATVSDFYKQGIGTILKKFGNNMLTLTLQDTVLDIGSGTGEQTRNLLLPFSGKTRHVVGGDISTSFLEYARNHYHHDRLTFEYMDIKNDFEDVMNRWGPFARVYSFYCLHWVKDHQSCLKNIASLLAPLTGECLLAFVMDTQFDHFKNAASAPRWADYIRDMDPVLLEICPYNLATAVPEFGGMMEKAGFEVVSCELVPMCFEFENVKLYKNFLRAINAVYQRIPESEREEFLNECYLQVIKHEPPNIHGGYPLTIRYTMLVAHGRMK